MRRWLKRVGNGLSSILSQGDGRRKLRPAAPARLPEVFFDRISVVESTPSNSAVTDKQFITVVYKGVPRWAMFRCTSDARRY